MWTDEGMRGENRLLFFPYSLFSVTTAMATNSATFDGKSSPASSTMRTLLGELIPINKHKSVTEILLKLTIKMQTH